MLKDTRVIPILASLLASAIVFMILNELGEAAMLPIYIMTAVVSIFFMLYIVYFSVAQFFRRFKTPDGYQQYPML